VSPKEVWIMTGFEKIEITFVARPAVVDVIRRIRRDEPCRASPLSGACTYQLGRNAYLLADVPGVKVCIACPLFDGTLQTMMTEWEEWVIAMEDAYC
jgi:hypothetical protein